MFKAFGSLAVALLISSDSHKAMAYLHHTMIDDMPTWEMRDYYLDSYEWITDSEEVMLNNALYSPEEDEFENLVRFGMEKPWRKLVDDINNNRNYIEVEDGLRAKRKRDLKKWYKRIHNLESDDLREMEEHMTQIIDKDTKQTIHYYYDTYVQKIEE